MTRTVLHIGFPKTASTTLQTVMMDHAACAYVGKGLRDSMEPSLSLDVANALFFLDSRRFEAAVPQLRDRLAEASAEAACLMISDEALTFAEHMEIGAHWQRQTVSDHDVMARRLATLCPGARVMMSVRNQMSFLKSYFRQLSKRRVIDMPFEDFIAAEIDALSHRSMLHLLRYDEALDAYRAHFAAWDIMVSVYETYSGDFAAYLASASVFCGLDPAETAVTWGGAHANKARPHRERPAVRKLRGMIPPVLRRMVPKDQRRRLKQAAALPPLQADFSPAHKALLQEYFAPSNARLATRAGLDLAPHGYPLP